MVCGRLGDLWQVLFLGVWGNRWSAGCQVVPYMGMEFRGFAKERSLVEREVETLFASVIVAVSGKLYPLL